MISSIVFVDFVAAALKEEENLKTITNVKSYHPKLMLERKVVD